MQYIAYGQTEPESVKVMLNGEITHIRMAQNFQAADPNDAESTGQWEETHQQIATADAPTADEVTASWDVWWSSGSSWQKETEQTLEQQIADLVKTNSELIAAISALLKN